MAPLSIDQMRPSESLSKEAIPPALHETLAHLFHDVPQGMWLVGGTALAGFYAKHRRSDDLDLFCEDSLALQLAIRSLKTLAQKGAVFKGERHTPTYFRAEVSFQGHDFTVDLVLDEFLHKTGLAHQTKDGFWVVSLKTLLALKFACLISRASEKDLFDLDWILTHCQSIPLQTLIEWAAQFDGGLTIETLLIGLRGAHLREEACAFLLPHSELTPKKVYQKIVCLRDAFIKNLLLLQKDKSLSEEAKALKQAVKDQKNYGNR